MATLSFSFMAIPLHPILADVIPHLEHLGRCIAPDMIGLGDSDPLPNSGPGVYKFATHRDYLFDFLNKWGLLNG